MTAIASALGAMATASIRLITKGGYNWSDRYPWIVEAAHRNSAKQFVIDGEAMVARCGFQASRPAVPWWSAEALDQGQEPKASRI